MAVKAHCMLTPFDATTGAALTGATVNVFQPGTVTPVSGTLFDKNGNTLTNPLTSDATTGLVDFYMNVAQEVDLQVAKSGYTTRTYSNVPVLDDASLDLSALMTTTGDVVYASAANTPARLALGANGTFFTVHGGLPAWQNTIDAGGLTITAANLTLSSGQGLTSSAATDNLLITPGGLNGFKVQGVASAVNYLQLSNAATLANPTLSAQGTDTDIGITITPKGTTSGALVSTKECIFGAGAAMANGATFGYLYMPGGGGAATGVPVNNALGFAIRYNTATNTIQVYNGAWRSTAALT